MKKWIVALMAVVMMTVCVFAQAETLKVGMECNYAPYNWTQSNESEDAVAIAAGGTAGHINPALALAEELRDRGHHVRFFGQTAKLEGRLVPEAGFELVPVVVSGEEISPDAAAVFRYYGIETVRVVK